MGQGVALWVGECGEKDLLVGQVGGRDFSEEVHPFGGQLDQRTASIRGVAGSSDGVLHLEPVEADTHRARRQAKALHEGALRQFVRLAATAERGDHGEVGRSEVVTREQVGEFLVEAAAEPADASDDLDRSHGQIR